MAACEDGVAGEQMAIALFKSMGMRCFQADLIVKGKDGKRFIVEAKNQEKFKAPPFDGHGLPPYQIDARLEFWKDTGIRCMFIVFDKGDGEIYYNWLDVLNDGEKTLTKTGGRVVFNINNFVRYNKA